MAIIVPPLIAWWNLDPRRAPRGPARPGPNRALIAALEQFKCDARLLVLDQARWSANPLAVLWSETGVAS